MTQKALVRYRGLYSELKSIDCWLRDLACMTRGGGAVELYLTLLAILSELLLVGCVDAAAWTHAAGCWWWSRFCHLVGLKVDASRALPRGLGFGCRFSSN
jgi:hypothetical protein